MRGTAIRAKCGPYSTILKVLTAIVVFACSAISACADEQPAFGCAGRAIIGSFSLSTGDGEPAAQAQLFTARGIARDVAGNIYIADSSNENVRKVDTAGIISTVAGNGIAQSTGDGGLAIQASLDNPQGVAVDGDGNIYISEFSGNRIRRISPQGIISTFAGNGRAGFSGDGGAAAKAMLWKPSGLAVDSRGNVFVSDTGNLRLRRIAPDGTITTVAGNGTNGNSRDPDGLAGVSISYTGDVIASVANGGPVFPGPGFNDDRRHRFERAGARCYGHARRAGGV